MPAAKWLLTQRRRAYGGCVIDALRPAEDGVSVDVLLRRPGEIEHRREDPGYMDCAGPSTSIG